MTRRQDGITRLNVLADLDHVLAEVNVLEDGWQQVLLDDARPAVRTAVPAVEKIHADKYA